jgi:opacity protein-like surface antigen
MTGHRRLAAAALAATLLLAAPTSGLAQGRPRASAATLAPSTTAPRATSPAPIEPARSAPPPAEPGPWRLAVTLGWEKDGDAGLAGPRAGLELERDLVALGTRGELSLVVPVGWFHASDSTTVSAAGVSLRDQTTFDLFEVIPAFRASWTAIPRLRLFAEIGVGAAWARTRLETSSSLTSTVSAASDRAFAGVLRIGAGASFQLGDRLRLGLEVPTIHRRYGDATSQTFTFSALAAYAF